MDEGMIVIRMPLNGKITVTAQGKGKTKVEAVEWFEKILTRFKKPFEQWYDMQNTEGSIKKSLEIAGQEGKEQLFL